MLHHKSFGEGPTLVVLHGLFGMLDNWQTLARQLSTERHVLLLDLRNHGRSPHKPEMDYHLMAEDVAETLESLGIDRCDLMGHSMGGKVAMQTALTYPELVRRLIVVDMTPRQYRPGHNDIFAALQSLDPANLPDRKAATEQLGAHISSPSVRLFLLKNLARDKAGGFRWRMNLPVIADNYPKLIAPVGKRGDEYGGPTLFVRGSKSGYVQDDDIPLIRVRFPAAQLITINDAGHWVHAEQPAKMLRAVEDFLP